METAAFLPHEPSKRASRRATAPLLVGASLFVAAALSARRGASRQTPASAPRRDPSTAGAARGAAALAASTDDGAIESWLNETDSDDVKCDGITYALCDIAACTLTGDGYTAACGCIPMTSTSSNEAKLSLGWSSAILTFSDTYLDALEAHANDDADDGVDGTVCDLLDAGGIWSGVDAAYTSLFGTNELVDVSDLSTETCSASYGAGCQGAPCWDVACVCRRARARARRTTPREDACPRIALAPPLSPRRRYDDHFSVTCLCPILGPDTFDFPKIQSSGASICDEMSSGSCAGVCKDATTYSYSRVLATISSIEDDYDDLLDKADSSECPITCDYCSYSYLYDD